MRKDLEVEAEFVQFKPQFRFCAVHACSLHPSYEVPFTFPNLTVHISGCQRPAGMKCTRISHCLKSKKSGGARVWKESWWHLIFETHDSAFLFFVIAHVDVESHGDFHVHDSTKGIYRKSESKLAAQIQQKRMASPAINLTISISPHQSRPDWNSTCTGTLD